MSLFPDLYGAEFSSCRTWRYRLWRRWDSALAPCMFLMLNPSTADELTNDPTVAKCERWARDWGYGSVEVCNLFALRSTNPGGLYNAADPVGPSNDRAIIETALAAGIVICAWGNHGALRNRAPAIVRLLLAQGIELHALTVTQAGEPGHPLYLPKSTQPFPFATPLNSRIQ